MTRRLAAIVCALALGATAVRGEPIAAVTTTMLEAAVKAVAGDWVEVRTLLPGGSCPGHFDVTPSQARDVAAASWFIRHDFQHSLDGLLDRAALRGTDVVPVVCDGAMTIPANFVLMAEQVAGALAATHPERRADLDAALTALRAKADAASADARNTLAPWQGTPVLAAYFQADFARWCGLEVAGSFSAGETASARELTRVVRDAKDARTVAVLGNLQWGPGHLAAMAEALGVPGIMLSNFPTSGEPAAYWALLEANIDALTALPQ